MRFFLPIFVALLLSLAILAAIAQAFPLGGDAAVYFVAAHAIQGGHDPAFAPGYLYPPTLALLLAPATGAIWMLGVAVSAALLIWILRPSLGLPLACVAVLCFAPTTISLYAGNISILIAVLYAVAMRDDWRGVPALLLGALLKLTPAVALVALATRSRRALLTAALLGPLAFVAALPWVRPAWWLTGTLRAMTIPAGEFASGASLSLTALLEFRTPYGAVAPPLTIVLAAITLWRCRTLPSPYAIAVASLLPLLVGRITWTNHAVMALPALALLWRDGHRRLAFLAWFILAILGGANIPLASWLWPIPIALCWYQLSASASLYDAERPTTTSTASCESRAAGAPAISTSALTCETRAATVSLDTTTSPATCDTRAAGVPATTTSTGS